MAIGAQNAFVLKQGLLRQHVFAVALVCALSDALLISLGVFGFAHLLSQQEGLIQAMKWFGAIFLFGYGLRSFYQAYRAQEGLHGSISSQYSNKMAFASGAVSASFIFFFSLAFGARLLEPVFEKPKAWKILDIIIGMIMWLIAVSLIVKA